MLLHDTDLVPDEQPKAPAALDSAYFDQWYADMETSSTKDVLLQRHLSIPTWLGSAGILHWDALSDIAAGVRLAEGGALVDVACGRGGYGIELARRTSATLTGVDFSAVAQEQARAIAARLLAPGQADFRVGTLTETGLATGTADALVCTDSLQFAEPPAEALREFRRVLRPGGRLALTAWAPTTPGDPSLGPRLRHFDLPGDLDSAGFVDVIVETRPAWRAAERRVWQDAVATEGGEDDAALSSLRDEGKRSLRTFDALQRVLAFATAP